MTNGYYIYLYRINEGVEGRVGEGIDGGEVGEGMKRRIGERSEERSGEGLEEMSDDSIKCICACSVEKEEMVCCDVCEGGIHLSVDEVFNERDPRSEKGGGTRKKESCNDIAKEMIRLVVRVGSQFSIYSEAVVQIK